MLKTALCLLVNFFELLNGIYILAVLMCTRLENGANGSPYKLLYSATQVSNSLKHPFSTRKLGGFTLPNPITARSVIWVDLDGFKSLGYGWVHGFGLILPP